MPHDGLPNRGEGGDGVAVTGGVLLVQEGLGRLGLQNWAVRCEAALWEPWFSNWEGRWSEMRSKALEGGGAL